MSGFLGYDPDRLTALRRQVAAALAEASTVRCADPLAAEPMRLWRRAVAAVEPWDARLASILTCGFASPYQPVAPSASWPIDLLRPLTPAWRVATDPFIGAAAAVDPQERVDQLVALLAGLDPALLGSAASLRRLLDLLEATFADGTARRRWFDALGPDGIAALVASLARWVAIGPSTDPVAAGAEAVLSRVARGFGLAVQHGDLDEAAYRRAALDGSWGDRFAAALVLRHAGLPSAVTAMWARDVLSRERPVDPAGLDTQVAAGQPHAGELVLAALTADPVAAREVLRSLDELDVVLGPHVDGDARGRFLLTALDPGRFPTDETVGLLQHVLGYLDDHRNVAAGAPNTRDLHDWLGACLAPYLTRLVPSPSMPVAGWGSTDVVDLMTWVSTSPLSAATLEVTVQELANGVIPTAMAKTSATPGSHAHAAMEQLGVIHATIERGQALWAAAAHRNYETGKYLAATVISKVATLPAGLLSTLASIAVKEGVNLLTSQLVDAAFDKLAEQGIGHKPPTEEEMTEVMALRSDQLAVSAWRAGAGAAAATLRAAGTLRPGSLPPEPRLIEDEEGYREQLAQWASRAGPAASAITRVADAAAAGYKAGRAIVPGSPPLGALDRFDRDGAVDLSRGMVRRTDKALRAGAGAVISEP